MGTNVGCVDGDTEGLLGDLVCLAEGIFEGFAETGAELGFIERTVLGVIVFGNLLGLALWGTEGAFEEGILGFMEGFVGVRVGAVGETVTGTKEGEYD